MKYLLCLLFLSFNVNAEDFQEYIEYFKVEENSLSHVLSTAYWTGCVQGKLFDNGKSKGKNSDFCHHRIKKNKYGHKTMQGNEFVELSTTYFYKGCMVARENQQNPETKCHELTKKYNEETYSMLNQ